MLKLAKTNLELADILRTLEVSVKKHRKSDFDFFRFFNNEDPLKLTPEYKRQLRLKLARNLKYIANSILNNNITLTEPLRVV